ncbi:MAG: hypothetical protein ACRD2L_04210, partial [Terriglobia bacterium]
AWDILSAIQKGFRAQVDVKGKLAEYFLNKELERLKAAGILVEVIWQDKDGEPDFLVTYRGRRIRIECKKVRSKELFRDPPAFKIEIQKTRNAIGGGPTRGYRADEFDVIAACLFNHTKQWTFLFAPAASLRRREDARDFLQVMQPVPQVVGHPWHESIGNAIQEALRLTGD